MHPRTFSHCCLSLLPLATACVSIPVLADSGIGVDTWRANKLDPTAGAASSLCDEDGTSWLYAGTKRSPTGYLYLCPAEPPRTDRSGDWEYSQSLELGFTGVSGDEVALWNRYAGWDDGLLVGQLDLNAENASDGRYAEVHASRLSDEDEYYQAVYGEAGAYKIQAFYREMPNVLSSDAHVLWNGAGTNDLTLPDELPPGASTTTQVAASSAAAPRSTLRITRSKEGVNLSAFLTPQWTAYADFTNEQRKGARPYGGSFFFAYPFPENGGVLETVKPIDDNTTNIESGVRYAGSQWRMSFSYSGSFYRDRYTVYDFEAPFSLYPVVPGAVSAPLYRGQMSTEPDNDYHNIQATLTRKVPMNGELSISGRLGRMSQDDDLIAPIDCQGVFGIGLGGDLQLGPQNPMLFSCADWNTPAALSRSTADMRIDLSMMDAQLVLRPRNDWTVRTGFKFDRQDYRNTYLAYNPLTGQYGYVSENGSQGSIVPGEIGFVDPASTGVTRISSLPLDVEALDSHFGADWRLSETDTLSATFQYKRREPTNRELAQIDDSSVKLGWTNRRFEWLTLRVNYAYLQQRGGDYNFDPYDSVYSVSLPGYVAPSDGVPAHTVEAMRKYDIAGRDEHSVDVMATVIPREDMTVTASLRGGWSDYDAVIGRTGYDTVDATLQFEWQPATTTNASAYLAWSRSRLGLSNVQDQQAGAGTDATLGGPNYAQSGQWWLQDSQRDYYAGAIFSQQIRRTRLDLSWNYIYSRGLDEYSYAGSSALGYPTSVASTGPGGGAFPAMIYRVSSVGASFTIPVADRVSLRVFDYYELGRISDWHYAGFEDSLVSSHLVYTDAGPQNYNANVIGVLFNINL